MTRRRKPGRPRDAGKPAGKNPRTPSKKSSSANRSPNAKSRPKRSKKDRVGSDAGRALVEIVAGLTRGPRSQATTMIQGGQVRVDGNVVRKPHWRIQPGQRVRIAGIAERVVKEKPAKPAKKPKESSSTSMSSESAKRKWPIRVIYQDEAIVVVEKPAGLTTVRHSDEISEAGRKAKFLPATLIDLLPSHVAGPTQGRFRLRAVHRLDRDTSGLVIVARTPEAERRLGRQFREHTIDRRYVALVRGQPKAGRIESRIVRDRGDGRRGSLPGREGQLAITYVEVIEQRSTIARVECRLETGRTHQVRIHLGEQGHPLCGERIYDRPLKGLPLPDSSRAARPMLHAAVLGVDHPTTGQRLRWTSPPPADFEACWSDQSPTSAE